MNMHVFSTVTELVSELARIKQSPEQSLEQSPGHGTPSLHLPFNIAQTRICTRSAIWRKQAIIDTLAQSDLHFKTLLLEVAFAKFGISTSCAVRAATRSYMLTYSC